MKQTFSRRELYAAGEPIGDSATREDAGRRIMGGGGGGNSTSTPTIPKELTPLANLYVKQAQNVAQTPWMGYQGQRFADMNATQNLGIGMIQDRALHGDPTVNAGANYLQNQLKSGPSQATVNPVGGVNSGWNNSMVDSGWNGSSVNAGWNGSTVNSGWNDDLVRAQDNPYAQQGNPYLDAMVNKAQANVLSNANQAAVRSGSFGNSGIAEQAAKNMGEIASSMYGNAWNTQAQLADANVARNLQAQQFNSGVTDSNLARALQAQQFNSGVTDSNLSRSLQAQQFNSGLNDANLARSIDAQKFNAGLQDSNIARSLQAQQFNAQLGNDWASRNDAALQNWRSNQINAAQLGLNYGNQAYQDAGQLINAGNMQQNNVQQNLDFGFQQFQDQQNYPFKQLQATGGVIGQNMGSKTTTSGGK